MSFSPKQLLGLLMIFMLSLGAVSAADLEQRSIFASPVLVVNTSFLNVRSGPGVQFSILATVTGGTILPVLGVANDGVWYQVATDLGPGWVNVEFTLARGDFRNVPLVRFESPAAPTSVASGLTATTSSTASPGGNAFALGVTVEGADLRAQPSTQAPIIRSLFGDPSAIYPLLNVTSSGGVLWAQLNVPDVGAVWTERFRLRPLGCSNVSVGVLVSTTQIRFDGISNQQAFQLEGGTEVFGVGFRDGLLLVQLTDGTRGLIDPNQFNARRDVNPICVGVPAAVAGQSIGSTAAPIAPSAAGNRVVVNTGNLNIRSGPSVAFSVIATVRGGTQLTVIGRARDNVWLLVEGTFGRGWLNSEFTVFRGVFSTVPIVEDSGAFAPPAPPNEIDPAPPSAVGTVSGNRIIVNTGNLNVRSGPGAAFGSITTVRGGTQLAVRGVTVDGAWYLVEGSFGQGWVDSEFVIFRGNYSTIPIVSY
ncbi:MAG: SH3 domain-containing protein [Anaerolineae bacterium]|nr:SH3 domain-containing protein [Anaerolineae bacterium]